MSVGGFLGCCSCRLHRCARGRRMCSYAWIDLRGGCALSSAQGRRPREPSASTGTSFGWRDDVELFTTLALVVRSYSYNGGLNAFAARFSSLCSSRSTLDLGGSSARGCVAVWDWRLMGQCCVFRQLHTDSATSVSQSRVLLRLCRPKRWRLVARGRGGPVPIGARHAHFVSRSRRPGIEPVSRVFTLDGRE
jgi:hypothetical protein